MPRPQPLFCFEEGTYLTKTCHIICGAQGEMKMKMMRNAKTAAAEYEPTTGRFCAQLHRAHETDMIGNQGQRSYVTSFLEVKQQMLESLKVDDCCLPCFLVCLYFNCS